MTPNKDIQYGIPQIELSYSFVIQMIRFDDGNPS